MSVDNQIYMLDILDTAGQEEFSAMRDAYFTQGQGFMIVWSVTDRNSFEAAGELRKKILRVKEAGEFPMVFCGNKSDFPAAEHFVSEADAKAFAKSVSCPYLPTSAKTRLNVEECFETLVREVRDHNRKTKGGEEFRLEKPRSPCVLL
eukprot:TRINITY_DN2068_c0_g3_i1.p1 TRINITY_DN2068_c0_g3~~TRINITY_DN2068_c0_g3_i1.p1  ORF type:complete len:148 (-),score=41.91 TRINITY_DN2068_c0_g3_i1:151-594(-)